jgi:hypothetical protein
MQPQSIPVSDPTQADYQTFLHTKSLITPPAGFTVDLDAINPQLFPFQRDIVRWALARGRAAIWADCGLGKTPMQLEWARHVAEHSGGNVLILAPLAVAQQTAREGEKFGIAVTVCERQSDVQAGINVTNYEKLHHFDPTAFAGIVLDESSILKAYDGKTRTLIIESFQQTPYRLACTATPAPNDYMELGNHAEFLGVMSRVEMLSMFFTHDGGETQKWRLKGHAESEYWRWLCSWAVMLRTPADLGYDAADFVLPPLAIVPHVVDVDVPAGGMLFALPAQTLTERRQARRASITDRVQLAADLANSSDEPFLIWCNLNAEADVLEALIPDAVQVAGRHDDTYKRDAMLSFSAGVVRVLVTKPPICGFGMNWQHCPNVIFVGLSDSYEQFYQAVRRCWRFGQQQPVQCHVITSSLEDAVVKNIQRKEQDAQHMQSEMVEHMHTMNAANIRATGRDESPYIRDVATGRDWTAHLGDCVEVVSELPDNSIDYIIFSPPFASLYTYSASDRDMGNSKNYIDFADHYRFLTKELLRVLKPGRLMSFHCMNLPTSLQHHGYIGVRDFRGDLIRWHEQDGFIYHSEVVIWKDPVTAMQRTKALGLLYKQLKKDSAMSRQGIPDYLVTMRKPGANPDPVTKDPDVFPVDLWQRYASPIWMDINPSNTLQKESAREDKDERHIAPLQLEVIERAISLWTNPNDLVLSPFLGIGSELYVAVKMGRRGIGAELKPSYWQQAVANLHRAEHDKIQPTIFDLLDE